MSLQRFVRYGLVGIGNTLVHGLVFFCLHLLLGLSQAPSNLLAFMAAASLSYCLNARFTFDVPARGRRYLQFLLGMGGISVITGAVSDWLQLPGWVTLLAFCAISLLLGYAYSSIVVYSKEAA